LASFYQATEAVTPHTNCSGGWHAQFAIRQSMCIGPVLPLLPMLAVAKSGSVKVTYGDPFD
jgi:hypothetical protein